MIDVMLIGEPLVLFSSDQEGTLEEAQTFSKSIAGAELNVGIGLSRLGHKVNYLTKLSQDDFGKYIYSYLEAENLTSEHIDFDRSLNSGIMFKDKVSVGDPKTLYYRKNSAASKISRKDVEKINFEEVKLVHVTGILAALSEESLEACEYVMKKARESGCKVTFDPNLRPTLWNSESEMREALNYLASFAHVVLPGISEGAVLSGSNEPDKIADFYLAMGVETVIIKDGGSGAFVKTKESDCQLVSGFPVDKVIDTVGAGDGFSVGVIDGILRNLSEPDVVNQGNAIGAIQVQHRGDNEGLPTRKELVSFILENNTFSA